MSTGRTYAAPPLLLWLSVAGVSASCNQPPRVPDVQPRIPLETLTLGHDLLPSSGTAFKHVFVMDDNVLLRKTDSPDPRDEDEIRLFPLDGVVEGATYRASRLALGKLFDPVYKKTYWSVAAECHGSLVIDARGLRLDAEGSAECAQAKAAFTAPVPPRPAPTAAEKPIVSHGACVRYRACVCGLAVGTAAPAMRDAFSKNCDDADRLLRTAPDDVASCEAGLTMSLGLARELSMAVPAACR